ncbi:MAG: dicarboxylate/amino acid:cation symporter [Alphaproteobacteria bacterium]
MPHRHAAILLILIALSVALGIASGWVFGPAMMKVEWIGKLFLDALKMLVVPLLVAAVVTGVASLGDVRKLGRLGGLTLVYFVATTGIAVLIGLIMVNLIRPGEGLHFETPEISQAIAAKGEMGWTDIIDALISPNLIDAAAKTEVLPLILFSIVLSAALTTLGRAGESVLAVFNGLNEALMKVVTWLMYLAPVGIFALIAARLGKAGGGAAMVEQIRAVGLHVVTVLSGLGLHLAVLIAVLFVLGRRGLPYIVGLMRALLTAFGTASSTATLPLTMECAKEQGVDSRAVKFVIPLGSTVNMNGTALYEAAAAMFIAQAYGLHMSLGHQAVIFVTATLAAVGAPGIPEAGIVTMVIVLKAVGLPIEGVGLLLAVDWFLDRFRTMINVWGDAVGAAVIARFLPGDGADHGANGESRAGG